jgi:glycosyltransferase involved in cell wall biosynthesis
MRFHILGLAHLATHSKYSACAYTNKIVRLCSMLKSLGHYVIMYGVEGSDCKCDEFVQVLSEAERLSCYGNYDMNKEFFKLDGGDFAYTTFNKRAIEQINVRKQERDMLLCSMGCWHQPVAQGTGVLAIESGIGYEGIFADFKVFESYAWMHWVYGKRNIVNGIFYDAVIPNYYDVESFPYQEKKGDYCLFVGRLVQRKGIEIAVEVTKRLGLKLIVAGQGSLVNPKEGLNITDKRVEHVGCVGAEERAKLMGGAKCVFVPTLYIEPFGGVAVEAQLTGTAVLATDWAVFNETILHGKTGYRCRTIEEFVWGVKNIDKIKPADCRKWAVDNYSMERVSKMYQAYFERIQGLWGKGFYEEKDDRKELDWLNRYYI